MTQSLSDLTDQILTAARRAGADAADAMASSGTSIDIAVRDEKLEQAERSEATEFGLRVFVGQRSAIVSASDTAPDTITALAERAVAMAREAPEDPYAGLAASDQLATDWDIAALDLIDAQGEPSPDDLRDLALECDAIAGDVAGISQTEGAGAGYGLREFHLAASNGFSGGYGRSSYYLHGSAISGEGTSMERDHDGDSRAHQSDLRSATDIGRSAGERAVAKQGARRPATGPVSVLFDERVGSGLIGHLLSASNGAMVARGSSWLLGKIGTQVLPKGIDLIEEPHRARASGSRPFDAEGLPTAERKIIADGTLTGWSLDLASARKLGLHSTGNAARGASSAPSPSVGNISLTGPQTPRADLIAGIERGIIVTSLIGSTINPNTGDYSRGASGFWVENGRILHPVSEVTIAGNLLDMLGQIVLADDARSWVSRRVPSLLVAEGMTLAGA